MLLKQEKLAADLACDSTKYASSNKITLSGTSKFSDAGSDPIGVIEDAKEVIRNKISRRPNIMVISPYQYVFLKEHKQLLEKIKYTETGIVTPVHMAKIFGVEKIVIGEAVCVKFEKIYRKAPLAAKKAAEQHLRLLEEIEQMDTPKHYLQGYNRYAEVKITENDLNRMREAYHDFGMYGLLPKEYQLYKEA